MKKVIFITILAMFALNCCAQSNKTFSSVSAAEFKEVLKDTAVILVDVRTAQEFSNGHIEGTKFNIDVLSDDFSTKAKKLLPAGSTLAIYCRSGNRSKTAARELARAGYKVIELSCGYNGWPYN